MNVLNKIKTFFLLHLKVIVLVIIIMLVINININRKEDEIVANEKDSEISLNVVSEEIQDTINKKIYVDVKGCVKKPGVYELDEGSRVIDAVKKAILDKNASTKYINLSKIIYDEMVIYIFTNSEVKEFEKNKDTISNVINNAEIKIDNKSIISDTKDSKASSNLQKEEQEDGLNTLVNINNASIEELMTLPGIGESKAQAILNYRNEFGSFISIEDIKNVSGIGNSIYENIKEFITV